MNGLNYLIRFWLHLDLGWQGKDRLYIPEKNLDPTPIKQPQPQSQPEPFPTPIKQSQPQPQSKPQSKLQPQNYPTLNNTIDALIKGWFLMINSYF